MDDEPDVRLVDSHAESGRRADDLDLVVQKIFLDSDAFFGFEPRMVGFGVNSAQMKFPGERFRPLARKAVDDAAFPFALLDEPLDFKELFPFAVVELYRKA